MSSNRLDAALLLCTFGRRKTISGSANTNFRLETFRNGKELKAQ